MYWSFVLERSRRMQSMVSYATTHSSWPGFSGEGMIQRVVCIGSGDSGRDSFAISLCIRKARRLRRCAGFPAWISNAGMLLVTTLPAAAIPQCSIFTPGQMTARAPTHEPSSSVIGSTRSPKDLSDQSWLPVQRYEPCEIQTFLPMVTVTRLSIQTSSPIQE